MVDMVEARKRAKAIKQAAEEKQKNVIRQEAIDPALSYTTAEATVPAIRSRETAVPATITLVDEVDYMQRLLSPEYWEVEAEVVEQPVQEEQVETLIFQLGGERYGLPIQQIVGIIRFLEPASVPHTVAFLDGIITVRGQMIPVINSRKRLGHEPCKPDKKTRIIVLQEGPDRYGILVDAVSQVVALPRNSIEPTPPIVIGIDSEFIEGVCEMKGQIIILLNLKRFLEFE